MDEQDDGISTFAAAKLLGVRKADVVALRERGELERWHNSPYYVTRASVEAYKERSDTAPADGVTVATPESTPSMAGSEKPKKKLGRPKGDLGPDPGWLTVMQVAFRLGITRQTVYQLCERGEIGHLKVGFQYRISQAHLDDYLQKNTVAAKPPDPSPTPTPVSPEWLKATNTVTEPAGLAINEAAKLLGMPIWALFEMCVQGKVRCLRDGRTMRIELAEVEALKRKMDEEAEATDRPRKRRR